MDECIVREYMQLKDAILHEQIDVVKHTLSNPEFYEKFINYKLYSKCHVTLLNIAVNKKNIAIVKLLLSLKLTPNIIDDPESDTSSSISNITYKELYDISSSLSGDNVQWFRNIQTGSSSCESLRYLVPAPPDRRWNIYPKPIKLSTPLHQAVYNQDIESVKLLLDHDANPNALDDLGHDTLSYVIKWDFECLPIIEMLLEKGARDNSDPPLLYEAIHRGKVSAVELYLKHINVRNLRDSIGKGPIHYAVTAEVRSFKIIHLLLEAGANINQADFFQETALHLAVMYKKIDIVKFLLDYGANINLKADDKTPLHLAVSSGNVSILKLILDKKPIFGIETEIVSAVLLEACKKKNREIVCELLRYGISVDSKTFDDKVSNFLIELIVKLDLEGVSIGEEYMKILKKSDIPSCTYYLNVFDEMRNCLVFENITILDIFFASKKKLFGLLRNEDVHKAIQSLNFDSFLTLKFQLNFKIMRTLQEFNKLTYVENKLEAIFGSIFPREIIWKFAEFSDIEDLYIYFY